MANTKVTANVIANDAVGLSQLHISNDPSNGQALTASDDGTGSYNLTWATVSGGVDGISSSADATAITIDSSENVTFSGNVGIGVAPTHNFNLQASGTVEARFRSTDGDCSLQISSDTDEGQDSILEFTSGTSGRGRIVYDHNPTAASQKMIFKTGDVAVDAMTITGAGRVGVDTSSPDAELHIEPVSSNASIILSNDGRTQYFRIQNNETDDALVFNANDTSERMRIDSNGRLNLGAVAHFADINQAMLNVFINSSSIPTCRFAQGSTSSSVPVIRCRHENSSSGFYMDFRTDENVVTGTIKDVSGTMTYASASDSRLKNNVETMPEGLTEVLEMNPVKFTWDEKKGGGESRGFVAQELNNQYSWAVQEGGDDPYEDSWQIDYSKLTPVLVKALQEQQTIIDDLKARIETLESN